MDLFTLIQQAQQQLTQLENRVQQLEGVVHSQHKTIEELKTKSSIHIDKIEYKFDQLKVETLEGTLNIGLNPFSGEDIEDFSVGKSGINVQQQAQTPYAAPVPNLYEAICNEMHHYVDNHGFKRIKEIEQETRAQLDDEHRALMLDDIRNQIEPRLPYYLSMINEFSAASIGDLNNVKDTILQRMRHDIDMAFLAYIQQTTPTATTPPPQTTHTTSLRESRS